MLTTQTINRKLQPDSHSSPRLRTSRHSYGAHREGRTRFVDVRTSFFRQELAQVTTPQMERRRHRLSKELPGPLVINTQSGVHATGPQVQIWSHRFIRSHAVRPTPRVYASEHGQSPSGTLHTPKWGGLMLSDSVGPLRN